MDPFRLRVPPPLLDALIAHARAEWPHECVGFLAGTIADGFVPAPGRAACPLFPRRCRIVRWRIWSAAFAVVALGLLARADDPPKKADDKKPDEKKAEPTTPAEKVAAVRKSVDDAYDKAR